MFQSRPCMRRLVEIEDGVPILHEEENIDFVSRNITLAFSPTASCGSGALYITTRRIIWISDQQSFDFDVPYITLHAITHDPASFPSPCIYCQFDEDEPNDEEEEDDDEVWMYSAFKTYFRLIGL